MHVVAGLCSPNDRDRTAVAGDFCDSGQCLNGGTCLMGQDNDIFCICPEGFTGSVCEEKETGTCSQWPASPVPSQVGSLCYSIWANSSSRRLSWDDWGREEKGLIWRDPMRLGHILLFGLSSAHF